ncbi:MAG: hypothetical protein ABIA63_04570 [bacterium]
MKKSASRIFSFIHDYVIRHKINLLIRRYWAAMTFLIILAAAYTGLDHFFGAPVRLRILCWFLVVPVFGYFILSIVLFVKSKKITRENVSLITGENNILKGSVSHGYYLSRMLEKREHGFSKELAEAAVKSKEDFLGRKRVSDFKPLKLFPLSAVPALMCAGLLIAAIIAKPAVFSRARRNLMHPLTTFERPNSLILLVIPGDTTLFKGDSIRLELQMSSYRRHESADLCIIPFGITDTVCHRLPNSTGQSFFHLLQRVTSSFDYYFALNQIITAHYHVRVKNYPDVENLKVTIRYPDYTRRPAAALENQEGDITALPGSRASLKIRANKETHSGSIIFGKTGSVPLKFNNYAADFSFGITRADTYSFCLKDSSGISNKNTITYHIELEIDEAPVVQIINPGQDRKINRDMNENLCFRLDDDFGFSRLNLRYKVESPEAPVPEDSLTIPIKNTALVRQDIDYKWDLSRLSLFPGDAVVYWAQIYDNNNITGAKQSESAKFRFIFPGFREIMAEVEEESRAQQGLLEELKDEHTENLEKTRELIKEIQQNIETDWNQRNKAQKLTKRARELHERSKEVAEKMQATLDKIEKNSIFHEETQEKLRKIHQLIQELITEKTRDMFKSLQKKIEYADKNKLRKMLEELKLSQEEYLKRLERTLALLEKIKMEQKLSGIIKRAESLFDEERKLKEMAEKTGNKPSESGSNNQKRLEKQMKDLESDAGEWSNKMRSLDSSMAGEMKNIQNSMNNIAGQMSRNAATLSRRGFSAKEMQNIETNMMKAINKLNDLQNRMKGEDKRKLQAAMDAFLLRLLSLSQAQEELIVLEKDEQQRNFDISDFMEEQLLIFKNSVALANDLFDFGRRTLVLGREVMQLLGSAVREMKTSLDYLEQSDQGNFLERQRDAMKFINACMLSMLKNRQSSAMAGMPGMSLEEMIQQMQGMSAEQMAINQITMELFSQPGRGQGFSMDERAKIQRLLNAQKGIQDALGSMYDQLGEKPQITGNIKNLQETVGEMVKKFENNEIDRELINRQEKVLKRLLDAAKSVRKQGLSRKRHSESGGNYVYNGVNSLSGDPEIIQVLMENMLNALKQDFPFEYKELIRKYFENLMDAGGSRSPGK